MEQLLSQILEQDDVRSLVSDVRKLQKENPQKGKACCTPECIQRWCTLLFHTDAKTRKNVALLLGDIATFLSVEEKASMARHLWQAYENEETKFVKSSYLQGLAAYDCTPFAAMIKEQYDQLLTREEAPEDVKHNRELRKAMEQILKHFEKKDAFVFQGMKKKHGILLVAEEYIREALCETLAKEHIPNAVPMAKGVRVVTEKLDELQKIPLYRELLFYLRLKQDTILTMETIGQGIVASELLSLVTEMFEGDGVIPFRLSYRSSAKALESKQLKKMVFSIEEATKHRLRNVTEGCLVELILFPKKDGTLAAFAKFPAIKNKSFSYCREMLPTSMAPVSAAQMVALALPYIREGAHVIDPFCGVGTLLIERCKKVFARDIYGVDTYGKAIEIARKHTAEAGMEFYYINRDYFDFTSQHLLDEVLTEFPRMEHRPAEEVDVFYKQFFDKTSSITAEDAMLILLSTEENLMKKQLRLHREFQLVRQIPMRGKENIFIITKRG